MSCVALQIQRQEIIAQEYIYSSRVWQVCVMYGAAVSVQACRHAHEHMWRPKVDGVCLDHPSILREGFSLELNLSICLVGLVSLLASGAVCFHF